MKPAYREGRREVFGARDWGARLPRGAVYLLVVASLVCAQAPAAAPDSVAGATAYLDAGAQDLVLRARERRGSHTGAITGYRALVRQRMFMGLRALPRDRVLYRQELAARIAWRRGGPDTVSVVGAREGVPIVSRGLSIPDDLAKDAPDVVFDPTDDRLMIGQDDSSFMYQPLASGGEANYRFRSGDTTEIGFADRSIRLIELRVAPRRADVHLMVGSLWIDAATGDVVEALFRPARPFDLERDASPESNDKVPGFLKPIRAELTFGTVQYAQWDGRWWLPRLVALEGVATVGAFAVIPFRYERAYSDYEIEGDTATVVVRGPPDSTRVRDSVVVRLAGDSAAVLASDTSPPSFVTDANAMISASDMRDLLARVPSSAFAADHEGPATVSWRRLARYNRVEGLSLGAAMERSGRRLALNLSARMGVADLEPNGELGVATRFGSALIHVTGYRRLAAANPWTNPLGLGNSLDALVLGRDDGAYFRAAGAELTVQPAITAVQSYAVRLFWERQTPALAETQASFAHWVSPTHRFLPNIAAATADQLGAAVILRGFNSELDGDASVGTLRFARVALTSRLTARLPAGLLGGVEAAAGTSAGQLPVQSLWYLGGPATLRGYDGLAAAGEAFWRGRVELANALPFPRLALFSDVGWAGARAEHFRGRPLMSVGVGASVFDGLLRADLARALRSPTGWRFDVYVDAIL